MSAADAEILSHVRARFGQNPPARLGVAVSGGGDSVALLHVLTRCFETADVTLCAATVDHGLRSEAAQEAEAVAELSRSLGVEHVILPWSGRVPGKNLQQQAREARYRLLADWARERRLGAIALGHTADDQAETVLMRLARSAGVDGLAAMLFSRDLFGVRILRPMLGLTRMELRAYLRRNGLHWVEDPSNTDLRFDRVKARQALAALRPLGVTVASLTGVAANMADARAALDWSCHAAVGRVIEVDLGDILLDPSPFLDLPREIARRLLVRALMWIAGASYPPRRSAVDALLDALRDGRGATLAGCRMVPARGKVRIFREYSAVRTLRAAPGALWDGRWQLTGPEHPADEIRALGPDGLRLCPAWRDTGRPHAALTASPSVWRGERLIAAPLAGLAAGWEAALVADRQDFFAFILSH